MNTKTLLGIALSVLMFPAVAQNFSADVSKSTIAWLGEKVTGEHNGIVNLKSGNFKFENNKIASGTFVIDMASMSNLDLKDNVDMMNKLMGHLKSDDFFGVENFPEASLTITKSSTFVNNKANVSGNLTIKGKTNPIDFTVEKNGTIFSTKLVVDRTLYNVRYGSGKFFENLGDKTIYDNFTLDIKLVTKTM